jgi:hypothetical protein
MSEEQAAQPLTGKAPFKNDFLGMVPKFVARDARARWRAPLGIVFVVDAERARKRHARSSRLSKSGAVLATVKGKSLRDGLRPPLTAAARSRRTKIRSGRRDVAGRRTRRSPLTTALTPIAPYKSPGAFLPYRDRPGMGAMGPNPVIRRGCSPL